MLQNVRSGFATLEKKLNRLVIAELDGDRIGEAAYRDYVLGLAKDGIGGFLLSGGARDEVRQFVSLVRSHDEKGLIIASSVERGVGGHMRNATLFPCPMALAAATDKDDASSLALLKEALLAISLEAADCGVNMPFLPAFSRSNGLHLKGDAGEFPMEWVYSGYRSAFLDMGLIPCMRLLPGEAGPPRNPEAEGLFMAEPRDGAAAAIQAGADLLFVPHGPRAALDDLTRALEMKRITEDRIDAALLRIHGAYLKAGPRTDGPVDYGQSEAISEEISQRAITLVKGRGRFLPVRDADAMPLVYAGDEEYFRSSVLRYYVKQASHVNKPLPSKERPALFLLFPCRITPDGIADMAPGEIESIRRLLHSTRPSIVAAFGDPSVLAHFGDADFLVAAYDTSPQAQDAVFRTLTGERPFSGQLPMSLSIPGSKGP